MKNLTMEKRNALIANNEAARNMYEEYWKVDEACSKVAHLLWDDSITVKQYREYEQQLHTLRYKKENLFNLFEENYGVSIATFGNDPEQHELESEEEIWDTMRELYGESESPIEFEDMLEDEDFCRVWAHVDKELDIEDFDWSCLSMKEALKMIKAGKYRWFRGGIHVDGDNVTFYETSDDLYHYGWDPERNEFNTYDNSDGVGYFEEMGDEYYYKGLPVCFNIGYNYTLHTTISEIEEFVED